MSYEFEKYITTADDLRSTIDRYGVAIIPSVLNDDECRSIVSGLWDFIEHLTRLWELPITREDTDSWKSIYKFYPLHSMLFQYFNSGHAQIAWDVRQNEKILDIFGKFYGCYPRDLLVSFDGFSFHLPPEVTNRGYNRNNTWYHTDQSYSRNDFEIVQSWITGLDVTNGDATIGFMESSNSYHRECAQRFNLSDKKDWYKISQEQQDFYLSKGCEYKLIACPKGSLVFWDSRTIHCGVESERTRASPNVRAVIYLCYQPRCMADEKTLAKKRKAFTEMRTTSHYPSKIKMFPKNPRTYGNPLPQFQRIPKPMLNDIGYRLAGF